MNIDANPSISPLIKGGLRGIDELFTIIENDKNLAGSYQRYPVRFIFIQNLQTLQDIVKKFNELGVKRIELSNYLKNDDGWLNKETITQIIKELDFNKDFVILGFSELVRFYKEHEFESFLNTLVEIENNDNKKRRLYIPFVGLYKEVEQKFLKTFHRRKEIELIWNLELNQTCIKFYITDIKIDKNFDFCVLDNTKEWLNLWKKNDVYKLDKIISSSKVT